MKVEILNPKEGDTKLLRKFAYLPIIVDNFSDDRKYKIWFESYFIKQTYRKGRTYFNGGFITILDWFTDRKYII
jgi:hypothetical protein